MLDKIKEGYKLFIRKEEDEKIGTLTLNDEDIYKDIVELNDNDMEFLDEYPNIDDILSDDVALYIVYNEEKERFMSDIKQKVLIGEYNDQVVWNSIFHNIGIDIMESLNHLEDNIVRTNERSVVK